MRVEVGGFPVERTGVDKGEFFRTKVFPSVVAPNLPREFDQYNDMEDICIAIKADRTIGRWGIVRTLLSREKVGPIVLSTVTPVRKRRTGRLISVYSHQPSPPLLLAFQVNTTIFYAQDFSVPLSR